MRMRKNIFVGMILLVLTMQVVFALGVSPGKTTLDSSDFSKTLYFNVLNSEHKAMGVSISSLNNSGIILGNDFLSFSEEDDSMEVNFTLNINPSFLGPGEHKWEILIRELAEDEETDFSAKPAVIKQVAYFIPYPSKYLISDVEVLEAKENGTQFIIPVINKGQETLSSVKAVATIYSGEKELKTLESESVSLESLERKELFLEWKDSSIEIGYYNASIEIDYDGNVINHEKEFVAGDFLLDVFDFYVKNFEFGSIVEFNVLVDNEFEVPIDGVYASMVLFDGGKRVANVKSAPYRILPGTKSTVPLFWDTTNLTEGKYKGKLTINYLKFVIEKDLEVSIDEFGIGVKVGSGAFVLDKRDEPWGLFILLALILLAIGLSSFKKKFSKKSKRRKRK